MEYVEGEFIFYRSSQEAMQGISGLLTADWWTLVGKWNLWDTHAERSKLTDTLILG